MPTTTSPTICSSPNCSKSAKFQCPSCLKLGIEDGSFFCSQVSFFRLSWKLLQVCQFPCQLVANNLPISLPIKNFILFFIPLEIIWKFYSCQFSLPIAIICQIFQDCFKSSWSTHKSVHKKSKENVSPTYDPFYGHSNFTYTGKMRAVYPMSGEEKSLLVDYN